jgi:hypothetical protein
LCRQNAIGAVRLQAAVFGELLPWPVLESRQESVAMDKQNQSGWTEGKQQSAEQGAVKQQGSQHERSRAGSGDARAPDRRIGEVAYADNTAAAGKQPKPAGKAAQKSQPEGPAAYAPHDAGEKIGKKQKADTPPEGDSQGGVGSKGGM